MAIFNHIFAVFIPEDFQQSFQKMSLTDKLLFIIINFVDKLGIAWHRLPVFLGLVYLLLRRRLYQDYNLFDIGKKPFLPEKEPPSDPHGGGPGSSGSFFGRNILPVDQTKKLKRPDPMVVATKLLSRRKMVDTGKQFNMIAASWIQFMIHDWVDHLEDTNQLQVELVAPKEVASECPVKSFRFYKTKEIQIINNQDGIKSGYINRRTAWWDASAIYGNNRQTMEKLRTFEYGKLKISPDGLLPVNADGTVLSGDVRNIWAGLATLHALCQRTQCCLRHPKGIYKEYPNLSDEELFRHARLVTSAVIAKIHTIDWTVELLKTDMLRAGMRGNWYGLFGKRFKDTFGHVGITLLSGIVGSNKSIDHGVPYSLTEEFVSVYRMHPLLPDKLALRNVDAAPGPNKSPPLSKQMNMEELIGGKGTKNLSEIGFTKFMVSMGHQACGALQLWNYPTWLRNLVSQNVDGTDRPDPIDLAALEIYRDRERSVARYNDFRRALLLNPISKWAELTDDEEAIETLVEVYGDDVEELDILVGLLAERKIKGFAISETAFVIFLLMATRRLEADKYFTSDFNEETYTKKGLEWVNRTESLKDVLDRHYPEMSQKWMNSTSAFTVWDASPEPFNPVPLYLRIPN